MIDPVSSLAIASASFSAIKKGFQIGRDIESMTKDLSRWLGALSDLEQAEKEAKNPPIFKKLFAGKSVEQEALEIFAAKKKAQEQRDELRQWLTLTVGSSAYDDLVRMEGQIRKQRQETLYRQRERRQRFVEIVVIAIACIVGIGVFAVIIYVALKARGLI